MSHHIAVFGQYDELWIVAERVISAEGIPAVDRAGRPIMPPTYETAQFDGSMVGLDNGVSLRVPHSPDEVFQRCTDAILRKSMLPQ